MDSVVVAQTYARLKFERPDLIDAMTKSIDTYVAPLTEVNSVQAGADLLDAHPDFCKFCLAAAGRVFGIVLGKHLRASNEWELAQDLGADGKVYRRIP